MLIISLALPYISTNNRQTLGYLFFTVPLFFGVIGIFIIIISIYFTFKEDYYRVIKNGVFGFVVLGVPFFYVFTFSFTTLENLAYGFYIGFITWISILIINISNYIFYRAETESLYKRGLIRQQEEDRKLNKLIKKKKERVQFNTFKTILQVSDRIQLDVIKKRLKMDDESFYKKLVAWKIKFDFIIEGDYIIVNKDTVSEFIDALDKQFMIWDEMEKDKKYKKID